jgi:hypothetical protein
MTTESSDHGDAIEIGPGVILALDEADYLYGAGFVALRVEQLGADPGSFPKLEWVRVVGRQIHWNGTEEHRDVMVRTAAIPRSLRPPTWRPPRYPTR